MSIQTLSTTQTIFFLSALKNVNSFKNQIITRLSHTEKMTHLTTVTPPTTKPLISTLSKKTTYLPSPRFHKIWTCSSGSDQERHVQRRSITLGLASVILGLSVGGGNASAAARRPPPPPPEEKKDPNVTGLAAKVLASKKRKEAMKESIAKLRERGKIIEQPPQ